MTRLRSTWITGVLLALTAAPAAGQRPDPAMSPAARAYLNAALDTLEHVTLRRDTINWRVVRDRALFLAGGAQAPADTYSAIQWALHKVNKHSFLQAGSVGVSRQLIDGRTGYVHLPQRGGASDNPLGDSLQTALRELEAAGACRWIVDLRDNGGGNMWPMLAGIGPLLGDSLVGGFVEQGRPTERWIYKDGWSGILTGAGVDTVGRTHVAPLTVKDRLARIAVLTDGGTGSSGEAIAIAFRGRPNTRSFGTPTAGFATVNRGAKLPDAANLVVTVGYDADRRGRSYDGPVAPDSLIPGPRLEWPSPWDHVAAAAAAWLETTPSCRPH